jgi:hypothetical protein
MLSLTACGSTPPVAPDGDPGDSGIADGTVTTDTGTPLPDGSPADCFALTYSTAEPVPAILLGEMVDDDTFTTYADSGHAVFEWGFQGGTMITPRIAVPTDLAREGDCVQITLENLADPDHPETAPTILDYFPVEGIDTYRVRANGLTDPVLDQISWDDPTGWHILLTATVRGVDFALTETVAVEIDPPTDLPPQCVALPITGSGCVYWQIAGEAMITAIEPGSSTGACPDPVGVRGVFTPSDPSHAECYGDFATDLAEAQLLYWNSYEPPSTCLEGYDVGSSIAATLQVIVAGTCPPYELMIDVATCGDSCT